MRPITPLPLADFRRELERLYTVSGRALKTRKQVDHVVRLAQAAGAQTTADLTTELVVKILEQRGLTANPNTTRGLLSRLRRITRLAIRNRWLDPEDAPDWESLWPEPVDPTVEVHASEDVSRLLAWLAARSEDWYFHRLGALAALVAYTGLRRMEALTARVEDVDLDQGFVFVTSSYRRLKRRSAARPVPMPDALIPILRAWSPNCGGEWLFPGARSGRPWSGGSPGYRPLDRLRQAGSAVGLPTVGFHSLRHTLSTTLLEGGTPEWVIQRILRHTSPVTTKRYLHPSDHATAKHVRGFRYGA